MKIWHWLAVVPVSQLLLLVVVFVVRLSTLRPKRISIFQSFARFVVLLLVICLSC